MPSLKRAIGGIFEASLRHLRRLWLTSTLAVVTAFVLGFYSGWRSVIPATILISPQVSFNPASMVEIFIRNMAVTSFLVLSGITVVFPSLVTFNNSRSARLEAFRPANGWLQPPASSNRTASPRGPRVRGNNLRIDRVDLHGDFNTLQPRHEEILTALGHNLGNLGDTANHSGCSGGVRNSHTRYIVD